MTAYTPIYNLPYVEASDLVASYPTVSEELAENVETALGLVGVSVIQATSTTSTTVATTTYTDSGLSATITPSSNTKKVLIIVNQALTLSRSISPYSAGITLLRDSTQIYAGDQKYENQSFDVKSFRSRLTLVYVDSPATTSAVTYKTQGAVETTADSSQIIFQPNSTKSSIILMEVS